MIHASVVGNLSPIWRQPEELGYKCTHANPARLRVSVLAGPLGVVRGSREATASAADVRSHPLARARDRRGPEAVGTAAGVVTVPLFLSKIAGAWRRHHISLRQTS